MARRRRLFVEAVRTDAVLTSYVLLCALLHAVSSSRRDHVDERVEMAPFIGHLGHAFIGIFGLGALRMPMSSFFVRALRPASVVSLFGDFVALSAHVLTLSVERLADECAVYTLIALLLVGSSLNVYWRSTSELASFDLKHVA